MTLFKFVIKLLIISLLLVSNQYPTLATNIYVNSGENIQRAINSACQRDTIIIAEGEYNENLEINKTINMQGNNTPIIRGRCGGPTITISASKVELKGFKIFGPDSEDDSIGILIKSKENNISGNDINGGIYGIELKTSNFNIILNNNINARDYGIFAETSNNNNISGNRINSSIGITISDVSNKNIIYNNLLRNIQIGIGTYCSYNNTIMSNNITTNFCCIAASSYDNDVYTNHFNCPDHVCEIRNCIDQPTVIGNETRFKTNNVILPEGNRN